MNSYLKEVLMEIIYHNKKVKEVCENFKEAIKKYGKEVAEKLHQLMNLIESFPNLHDIKTFPSYRVHLLKGDRKGQYSITISRNSKRRVILYPLDEEGKLIKDFSNEHSSLIKTVKVEIMEVSEHYE
jgi:proteic killer suppression protein